MIKLNTKLSKYYLHSRCYPVCSLNACNQSSVSISYGKLILKQMWLIGLGRVNQLGGVYINGKPLPKEIREEIIELARLGVRPCDISRRLKITHGCISKLLSKYQKTGSINPGGANVGRPRVITPKIEEKIEQYRREQPGIFSWELRDRLLNENVCSRENLPSLSSISRLIKHKMMARAACNKQGYNKNDENSRMSRNISSHSIDDILNLPTGFQSPEDQGKGIVTILRNTDFTNFLSLIWNTCLKDSEWRCTSKNIVRWMISFASQCRGILFFKFTWAFTFGSETNTQHWPVLFSRLYKSESNS